MGADNELTTESNSSSIPLELYLMLTNSTDEDPREESMETRSRREMKLNYHWNLDGLYAQEDHPIITVCG